MYPRVEPILTSRDNYAYLVHERTGRGVAVVDPGSYRPVQEELTARSLRPLEVWLTHKHIDHIGGAVELARQYDVPIRGPSEIPEFSIRVLRVSHGQSFLFGNAEVRVSILGGHTREHAIYLVDGALFTGDALFIGGCGRIFEGSAEDLYRGLRDHICSLPDTTRIYCGHEYAEENLRFAVYLDPGNDLLLKHHSSIRRLRAEGRPSVPGDLGVEKGTNPFLRVHDPRLRETLKMRWDELPKTPAGLFTFIRRLRDGF